MADRPWIFRTYSGHSNARASNALYRQNLAKGQTGLSIAFDLPTQTGYDSDHTLAMGEVGKVGVPIGHLGDMETLFAGIPLGKMNTSMTINATAPWLLALYIAAAERQGAKRADLAGTQPFGQLMAGAEQLEGAAARPRDQAAHLGRADVEHADRLAAAARPRLRLVQRDDVARLHALPSCRASGSRRSRIRSGRKRRSITETARSSSASSRAFLASRRQAPSTPR